MHFWQQLKPGTEPEQPKTETFGKCYWTYIINAYVILSIFILESSVETMLSQTLNHSS